jgi:hypothetical protein
MQMVSKLTLSLAALLGLSVPLSSLRAEPMSSTIAPSAQISEPAGPSKLKLIKQFLELVGQQEQLDIGSFLERYALPGGPMWPVKPDVPPSENFKEGFEKRLGALKAAYIKRRAAYQQFYEEHLNWEFTEAELQEIVAFLSKPVGKHYLDGRWRMEAYTNTNTEGMEEEIVKEAAASLAK